MEWVGVPSRGDSDGGKSKTSSESKSGVKFERGREKVEGEEGIAYK